MNANKELSNIYGSNSPQDFHHVSLTGGCRVAQSKAIPKFYEAPKEVVATTPAFSMSGGARKKKSKGGANEYPVYANGTYVQDKTFDLFRNTFSLNWYLTNPRYNALWVLEEKDTVEKFCKVWLDYLKEKGIVPGSEQASKLSASATAPPAGLRYAKDIFDVYTNPNNVGMDYHIPRDFPMIKDEDLILRRTNRAGDTCYFKFLDANKIVCSVDKEFPTDPKKTTTLKLLAKCSQSVFIITGPLPQEVIDGKTDAKAKGKASKKTIYSIMGGGNAETGAECKKAIDYLAEKVNDGDLDNGAAEFLAEQVLDRIDNEVEEEEAVKEVSKFMTGDRLFSALKIIAAGNAAVPEEKFDPQEIAEADSMLINSMKVMKALDDHTMQKFTKRVHSSYHNACLSKNPTERFIKDIAASYTDINDFKADVATQYVREHKNIRNVFNIFKAIDDALNGQNRGLAMNIGESSAINDIVMNALSEGVTSVNAKANIPTLMHVRSPFKKVLNCKGLKGGAVEEPQPAPVVEELKAKPQPIDVDDDDDGSDDEDQILAAFNKFH